jgi:hypothetical protein
MTQTAQERNDGFNPQELELAQGELKVAMMFADYSCNGSQSTPA